MAGFALIRGGAHRNIGGIAAGGNRSKQMENF